MKVASLDHRCTLKYDSSRYVADRTCWERLKEAFLESLLVSDTNPQTRLYFRNLPEIEREKERQRNYGPWVVHPYSAFRLYIELVMILIFFFHLMHTPWDMLFNVVFNEPLETAMLIILIIVGTCGVLDMIITFYTGYLDETTMVVVLDRKKIRKLYYKSWYLIFDIIATTPTEIIISYVRAYNIYYTRWLLFMCITRLCRLPTFVLYMNNAADLWHVKTNVYKCVRYVIFAILIVSWVGCMSAVISMFTYLYHPDCMHLNWVIQAQIDHEIGKTDLITIIVFRAISTVIGVKHGKFPNVNPEDQICASLSFFFGFFVMTFFLVLHLQMIMDDSLAEMSNYSFLNQLEHYMAKIRLPFELRTKIIEFYHYKFRNNSMYDDETMIMLSESLEKEVAMHKYKSILLKANIANDLPPEVIENMLLKVHLEYFMTGDYIMTCGEVGTCMYFIITGTVAAYTRFGVEVCHLHDGAYFGEVTLILDERRTTNVIALEPSEVCKLNRKDFYECIDTKSEIFKKLYDKATETVKYINLLDEMHIAKMTTAELLLSRGRPNFEPITKDLKKKKPSYD